MTAASPSEPGRAFAREVQYAVPDEWCFLGRDPECGLSPRDRFAPERGRAPLRYRFSRTVDALAFDPDAPLFGAGRAVYGTAERAPGVVRGALHLAERLAKVPLFGCKECGDCSLPDVAYLCLESQCAKIQRNGPCGGTRRGKCEVGDMECIWALAYDRLKAYGEESTVLDGPAVIDYNSLRGTSAWANTFLGRDHHVKEELA